MRFPRLAARARNGLLDLCHCDGAAVGRSVFWCSGRRSASSKCAMLKIKLSLVEAWRGSEKRCHGSASNPASATAVDPQRVPVTLNTSTFINASHATCTSYTDRKCSHSCFGDCVGVLGILGLISMPRHSIISFTPSPLARPAIFPHSATVVECASSGQQLLSS